MFGSKSKKSVEEGRNGDVTKLFFDSFSARISQAEKEMRGYPAGLEKIRNSLDQGRVSDLVLLERIQRVEGRVTECMDWISKIAGKVAEPRAPSSERTAVIIPEQTAGFTDQGFVRYEPTGIVSPVGLVGSIQALTTATELGVLSLLGEQGAKSAPEIGRYLRRSREHTARLMKKLLDEGYVLRDQTRIPYRYTLSERVRQGMVKARDQNGGQEVVSNPPA